MKVIADHAPGSIKENVIKNYFGRKIAIDASMSLYQFLIAVRPDDTNTFTLTNDVGETTSYEFAEILCSNRVLRERE